MTTQTGLFRLSLGPLYFPRGAFGSAYERCELLRNIKALYVKVTGDGGRRRRRQLLISEKRSADNPLNQPADNVRNRGMRVLITRFVCYRATVVLYFGLYLFLRICHTPADAYITAVFSFRIEKLNSTALTMCGLEGSSCPLFQVQLLLLELHVLLEARIE
ncbi:hypothetical protein EVAR_24364_1 [Eumeta japonica]|uniref:Uncharacterized protein n=1 Tax=Eumeta variegata TaxID=151549 RepID=A0A4C1YAR6_EUMVA|nr:hypothetical protein EVAR_24364_1 [Eumeta japonica]